MMKKFGLFVMLCVVWLSSSHVMADQMVLQYVPAYSWYHGCGPTGAAMIMGYWDSNGYGNLFDASGWDAVRLTDNVKDQISSPAHNAKYDPKPDDPNLPAPADTSIADFFHTSEGILPYGASYVFYSDTVFSDYAAYRGYQFDAEYQWFADSLWSDFVAEIDAKRPVALNVDSSGDGIVDHFVAAIGYEDRGADGLWYAAYSGWSESETDIYWKPFHEMSSSSAWGISSAIFVTPHSLSEPEKSHTPEPATLLLLASGLIGIGAFRKNSTV